MKDDQAMGRTGQEKQLDPNLQPSKTMTDGRRAEPAKGITRQKEFTQRHVYVKNTGETAVATC